jgi:hypothetical protein
MKWDGGHTAEMRVERVEEPRVCTAVAPKAVLGAAVRG